MCLYILQHRRHQIGISSHQVYGLLFDGAWLWEEYMNVLLYECPQDAKQDGAQLRWFHPKNRTGQGKQHLFGTANNGTLQTIYPDFIGTISDVGAISGNDVGAISGIGVGNPRHVIADAKYKPDCNIKREDYFQLLAYMFRFDAKSGYYLHPVEQPSEPDEPSRVQEQGIPGAKACAQEQGNPGVKSCAQEHGNPGAKPCAQEHGNQGVKSVVHEQGDRSVKSVDKVQMNLLQGVNGFEGGETSRCNDNPITVTKLGLVIPSQYKKDGTLLEYSGDDGFCTRIQKNEGEFIKQLGASK